MKKTGAYLLGLLCFTVVMQGQDMHFSQFSENPSQINPAMAGTDGIRASLNYRTQWRSVSEPYKTYGASYEMRLPPLFKKRGNGTRTSGGAVPGRFGVGLSAYKDKMGDGSQSLTQANLSLAYFIPAGEKHSFSLGLITSYNQRRQDNTKYIFPNQYGGNGYNPDLYSGENVSGQRYGFLDFAAGGLWTYGDEERRIRDHKHVKARIGVSVYHLMQPRQKNLVGGADVLSLKYLSHGDFHISIQNTNLAIAPAYLFQMQGPSMEIMAGALLKYYTKNDTKYTGYVKRTSYSIGAFYRNSDAVIIYGLLEWEEQYAVGISYDVNMSPLAKASGLRGGLELTLRYSAANKFLYQKLR